MTWLLAEDEAVKAKFAGLTVTDVNAPVGGRPVGVRFANPEQALKDMTYPMILIERQGMLHMPEREHRGRAQIFYWPEGQGVVDESRWSADTAPTAAFPVPKDVPYQITVLTRRASHQIELVAKMAMQEYLPDRFGYLEVPQDGTVRSLFLDGGPDFSNTKDEVGKRLLATHYVVRIPTEIPPVLPTLTDVAEVDITLGLK